jgi:Gram-negative bacterial TonB protein C-terminal
MTKSKPQEHFLNCRRQNIMRYLYTLIALLTLTFAHAQERPTDYMALDVKPECLDGLQAFYMYINNNIAVPRLEKDATLRITIGFIVEKDGSITIDKVIKDPGYGLGAEAARVIKECPLKWSPGLVDGNPVRAQFILPVVIKVEGEPQPETESKPSEKNDHR